MKSFKQWLKEDKGLDSDNTTTPLQLGYIEQYLKAGRERWYIKTHRGTEGPYTKGEVQGLIALGRLRILRNQTQVRLNDTGTWEPIHQVPQLIPEEVLPHVDLEQYREEWGV